MQNRPTADEEVARTLQIMDELERAQPSPWFYARIQAKLAPAPAPSLRVASWQWAALVLLLLANALTVYATRSDKAEAGSDSALIQAIRTEYGFDDYTSHWFTLTPRQ
jgi:hypothetical protein